MSISYSGTFKRSAGLASAIAKQLNSVNLKPVKAINVQFDPFHPTAVTARDFLHSISTSAVTSTNLNCIIKSNVVCDRSEPVIKIDLLDTRCIKFLVNNLSLVEILTQFNKHISSQVVIEEVVKEKVQKIKKTTRK